MKLELNQYENYLAEYKLFLKRNRIAPNSISKNVLKEASAFITHIEDLMYDGGEEGTNLIFEIFNELFNKLKGNISNNEIKTTIKYDGCLATSTLVCTNKGVKSLAEIILNDDKHLKVLTFNFDANKEEYSDIYSSFIDLSTNATTISNKSWYKVTLEDDTEIICTEDHLFYVEEENLWVKAKDLLNKSIKS